MDGQHPNSNHGFNQGGNFFPLLDVEPNPNFRPDAGGDSAPDPFPVLNSSFHPGADYNTGANIDAGASLNHNIISGQHDEKLLLGRLQPCSDRL